MVLPIHKSDYRKLPQEDDTLKHLRDCALEPGFYVFPSCETLKEMKSEEMSSKVAEGPVGHLLIRAENAYNIGRSMIQWFVLSIVISAFSAYIAWFTQVDAMGAMRIALTTSIMAYGLSYFMDSIWKGAAWSGTFKYLVDAALYAIAAGYAFYLTWPELSQ